MKLVIAEGGGRQTIALTPRCPPFPSPFPTLHPAEVTLNAGGKQGENPTQLCVG